MELFDELTEALEISTALAPEDRKYFDRLAQFVRDWQPKSETQRLKEFVEYLDYFEQAGGSINLEQESGDAVQLMTAHAAKGLEFDHVYVLRLVQRGFPAGEKPRVLEFPARGVKIGNAESSLRLMWDPLYAPLRKTERFKTLMRNAGIVDYWHARGWPDLCHPTTGEDFVCS